MKNLLISGLARSVRGSAQSYSTSATYPSRRNGLRYTGYAAGFVVAGSIGWVVADGSKDRADRSEDVLLQSMSFGRLLRSYLVFSYCSIPVLVDSGPSVVDYVNSSSFLAPAARALTKWTFFEQFHPGETAEESLPIMHSLRQKNIGALFCYNVEPLYDAPEDYVPDPRADVEETIKSIRVASQFEKDRIEAGGNDGARTWVSLKISGLMADPLLLKRRTEVLQRERVREEATTGEYPYLVTDGDWERLWSIDREDAWQSLRDVVVLDEAYENLREIMSKAKEEGIRVFIDAEQTWYQPAIDVLQEKLMREFNGKEELPIVCATYQAYLRRCEGMVTSQLARAEAGGFSLGMKLVRGAYHDAENDKWTLVTAPPVYNNKSETDTSYINSMGRILDAVQQRDGRQGDVLSLFGSHNSETVQTIKDALIRRKLATIGGDRLIVKKDVAKRISFGQLYGMNDGLTSDIVAQVTSEDGTPIVLKVLPYGSIQQCMPWIARRAVDNKALLRGNEGAVSERHRIAGELTRRTFLFWK